MFCAGKPISALRRVGDGRVAEGASHVGYSGVFRYLPEKPNFSILSGDTPSRQFRPIPPLSEFSLWAGLWVTSSTDDSSSEADAETMRMTNQLSSLAISRLAKPGRYGDGGGLWLQVSASGTKSWLFRYMRNGRARQMGLGPSPTVTLARAREKAADCRRVLADGLDPIDARRAIATQSRLEIARQLTFRQCAEKHIACHEAGWRNDKHRAQWKSTLATYVFPVFGELPVAAVDTVLVLKVLEPIWTLKPETAGRVRGRIESILAWAKARGFRKGDNPATWRGHLDQLLPARAKVARVQHHPALPYLELPAFMVDLRARDGISARAFEFLILTAARTSEALGAQWSEVDSHAATWIVPGARMKAGCEHRVPLSDRALAILTALPREGKFVFPGSRTSSQLSNMTLLMMLRRMGRGDLRVGLHVLRSGHGG